MLILFFTALHFLGVTGKARYQAGDCRITLGTSTPKYPPILTDGSGSYILPSGDITERYFEIPFEQVVVASCPGTTFQQAGWGSGPLYASCQGGQQLAVWTSDTAADPVPATWSGLGCTQQPTDTVRVLGSCGRQQEAIEIEIGFATGETGNNDDLVNAITICFDQAASKTHWARHNLWDEVRAGDHSNDSPPFNPDNFFDYDVNTFYTMAKQRETIAELVGSQELADKYVQDFNSGLFLSRGHLAPNADFIFYSWMDASYHFVNVAPQWQSFNGKNWFYLEDAVRKLVTSRQLDVIVYTGTHGVTQLEDINGNMVDIYLYNGNRLRVPRFYWKIIYDPVANAGVAVIGVNNPHLSAIPEDYRICPALSDHPLLDNVNQPENIERGVVWACAVGDLSAVVPETPDLPPMDILI